MRHSGLVGSGEGYNNTMSLWTWPWTQGRHGKLVGRRNWSRQRSHPDVNGNRLDKLYPSLRNYSIVLLALALVSLFYIVDQTAVRDLEKYGTHALNGDKYSYSTQVEDDGSFDGLRLAVLVAGSTQRFLFESFVERVAVPAAKGGAKGKSNLKKKQAPTTPPVRIDYFALLTLVSGPAFRQDQGYMGHLKGRDPLFQGVLDAPDLSKIESIQTDMVAKMNEALETHQATTTKVRALRLLENPIEDDPVLDAVREREAKLYPNSKDGEFDVFQQFPMMDGRDKALSRTKAGNRNMVRLFLALESLWTTEFSRHERVHLKHLANPYDYVLILRDDTLWLGEFDLNAVVATDPTADAYVLSCDARDPHMLPPEVNDHGILVKRSKAELLGKYVTSMATTDLQKCHASVHEYVGQNRGCNSEMILKHILEEHKLKVQLVPQSLLPFERAVLIDGTAKKDAKSDFYCYHKFCQSVDAPLQLPTGTQKCKELEF